MFVVAAGRFAPFTVRAALAGMAVASLFGCSGSEGFSRVDAGLPLGIGSSGGSQFGSGGAPFSGTGGSFIGSGGMAPSTGGMTGAGSGGMSGTGGLRATGGTPGTGGVSGTGGSGGVAIGGRSGSGGGSGGSAGMTASGGSAGRPATGGAAGGNSGGTGGTAGNTGTRPCDGLCVNPISVPPRKISGNLGTGMTCHEVIPTPDATISGVNCGNFVAPRTFSVNAVSLDCGPSNRNFALPTQRNGGYCMQASAGNNSFAYFITF